MIACDPFFFCSKQLSASIHRRSHATLQRNQSEYIMVPTLWLLHFCYLNGNTLNIYQLSLTNLIFFINKMALVCCFMPSPVRVYSHHFSISELWHCLLLYCSLLMLIFIVFIVSILIFIHPFIVENTKKSRYNAAKQAKHGAILETDCISLIF